MTKHPPLYVRKEGKVQGPFPQKQISQSLLLGRFALSDEVSVDKEEWKPIRVWPDLVPEVMQSDPGDDDAQERLNAAKRWADERRQEHAAEQDSRRAPESYEAIEYRNHRESIYKRFLQPSEFSLIQTILVLLMVAGLVYAGFKFAPRQEITEAMCDKPAAVGVNWRNCSMPGLQSIRSQLTGAILDNAGLYGANLFASNLSKASVMYADLSLANLSYVDFTQANLKGASLQRADLTQATFSHADLSYVDFTGAKMDSVKIDGAKLDHAIWFDGRKCLRGSVGVCKTQKGG